MSKEKIFQKLKKGWKIRPEINALNCYLKNPVWVIMPKPFNGYKGLKETELGLLMKKTMSSSKSVREELTKILRHIRKSQKNRALEQFVCSGKIHGACYPLLVESEVFGFVMVCGLQKKMSTNVAGIFTALTDVVIREVRREIELDETNMTIRPRAVALSMVHTLHRITTFSLDLNELLPKIARLSLQIIRANRCSIKLVDKKKKILLPKTTIDIRKKKTKLKKVRIGKYAPGRAVKKLIPIRSANYLAVPMIDEDVVGVITIYDKLESKEFTQSDEEIMKTLAEQAAIAIKNAQLFKEQEDLTLSSIKCIAQLLADRPHGAHPAEGSFIKLITVLGKKFNMNETEIKMLQYAAMLHDAGQISIPEEVLMKKGELTGYEYNIIKKHPMKGAKLLSKFKPLKPIVPIILYHHENFDGTGYPKGLKGKDIPLAARILGIVGVFEVMITEKPYRKALSINAAIKEIKKSAGKQFDPVIVEVFSEDVRRKDVRKLLEKELGGR